MYLFAKSEVLHKIKKDVDIKMVKVGSLSTISTRIVALAPSTLHPRSTLILPRSSISNQPRSYHANQPHSIPLYHISHTLEFLVCAHVLLIMIFMFQHQKRLSPWMGQSCSLPLFNKMCYVLTAKVFSFVIDLS